MLKRTVAQLFVGLILLLIWKLVWDYRQFYGEPPIRAVVDIWDLRVYYQNGKWFPNETQPYIDVASEYPQIPTYLFGWMHWFSRKIKRAVIGREVYFRAFSLLMAGFAYLNFILLANMLSSKKWLALFLFLPGPLYFSLYRFDALPTFFVLLAIFFVRKRWWYAAAILLGIATFTKWYAVVLLPLLLVHMWSINRKIPWQVFLSYLMTCILIVTPTLLAGGIDALLVPYQFHSSRGIEMASLPGFLFSLSGKILSTQFMVLIFLGLQVITAAISFFVLVETQDQFENWAAIILGCFVLFSRIFSPQWILWVLPVLILCCRDNIDILLVAAYGILTYIAFPIVFDLKLPQLPLFSMLSLLPLFILMLRYAMRIKWKFAYSFTPVAATK